MANRQPPKKETIDDFGLQHWIDAGRAKQNGYGWKDFDLFCKKKMPNAVMGRVFNKSEKTIKAWKERRSAL